MKILIPTSPGGHLKQSLLLAEDLEKKFDIVFVTYRTILTEARLKGKKVVYVIDPQIGFRSLFKYILLLFQAFLILLKENPIAIVSPGSNVPVPFCYLGKLMGKKIIFIESWSRVTNPSLSGKLVYKIADLFFIQWDFLQKKYPKAIYSGRLM